MINLSQIELPTGHGMHCGTTVTGFGHVNSRCKDSNCGRKTPMLLGGYCTSCAVLRGVTALKACGVEPIRLTAAACVAVEVPSDTPPAEEVVATDPTPASFAAAA